MLPSFLYLRIKNWFINFMAETLTALKKNLSERWIGKW